ncbi:hypothetical protein WJX79_006829 [Trebouxia sp. C0005]
MLPTVVVSQALHWDRMYKAARDRRLSTRTRSRSLSRTPHNVEDGPSEMKDTIQTWAASHLLSMAAKLHRQSH